MLKYSRFAGQTFFVYRKIQFSTMASSKHSLSQVVQKLTEFAPLNLAEKWDNVGLLIEPNTPRSIENILLTNDLTERVLEEAISKRTDLIISYHPPIFAPLKRITQSSWKERIVSICLENRIALFSPHTSWDSVRGGVGDWLAKALPHADSRAISPSINADSGSDVGVGRFCDLMHPIKLRDAIEMVKNHTGINNVHVSLGVDRSLDTEIRTFAICPGSGSSVLKGVEADLYITGEMSHHELLDASHSNINVILCNHSNSERGYLKEFKNILSNLLNDANVKIHISETDVDPLETY